MSNPILFKLTDAGKNALLDDGNAGLTLRLTHVGIGQGKYTPTSDKTALDSEISRHTITAGGIEPASHTLRFSTTLYADTETEVWEIGVFDENNILFAVASRTDKPLLKVYPDVAFVGSFGLTVDALDISHVQVVADPNGAMAVALMQQHLAHADPHPQYALRSLLDEVSNTVIKKLQQQVEQLKIPIGGLLITEHHYENSQAIYDELGYGNWIRTAQGKAIVGQNIKATDWTAQLGATHNYATGDDVRQAQVFAVWQRVPDDYLPPTYRVYWTSDEQGNAQIHQINEGQKAFLWAEVANLTTPQPIGAVLNGDKHDNISIAGGRFNFPEKIDNGKTKLGEFTPTAISKDMTISMGISLPNDEQVLAKLTVKNQIHEIGRRTTTLPLVIQRQNYGDGSTDMIQLPYIIATADHEDYNPNFVEFDSNGNRRLSNNNANQAGFYPSGSIGERIGKSITAMSNPRLHDIWFYVPATQPIKHVSLSSLQSDLFGYRVERYTGVYNGLYSDNLPETIRNQSKDWIILRANDEPDKTIILIKQAQNKDLYIHIDF